MVLYTLASPDMPATSSSTMPHSSSSPSASAAASSSSQVDGLPSSSGSTIPFSPSSLSISLSPGMYPLVRRPSCLSRTLSNRSTSSTSSNASSRSVRFSEDKPRVKYTYPKEVYDRAPIEVDENLALKRCREMQDHDSDNTNEASDTTTVADINTCPAQWAADSFYATESEEIGTLNIGREGSDTLPNLTMSDSSVSSCSDDCDSEDNDSGSEGTYYSPTPSQILSRGSLDDGGRNCFFDEPAAKQLVTKSPSAARLLGSPSSPAIPNFLRWDREKPASVLILPERECVGPEGVVRDNGPERERRRLLRLKMQERAKTQENDWDSCLGGF